MATVCMELPAHSMYFTCGMACCVPQDLQQTGPACKGEGHCMAEHQRRAPNSAIRKPFATRICQNSHIFNSHPINTHPVDSNPINYQQPHSAQCSLILQPHSSTTGSCCIPFLLGPHAALRATGRVSARVRRGCRGPVAGFIAGVSMGSFLVWSALAVDAVRGRCLRSVV